MQNAESRGAMVPEKKTWPNRQGTEQKWETNGGRAMVMEMGQAWPLRNAYGVLDYQTVAPFPATDLLSLDPPLLPSFLFPSFPLPFFLPFPQSSGQNYHINDSPQPLSLQWAG